MTAERQPRSKLMRFGLSILIIGHLLAVVLPPLSFQTRGPLGQSPSVATMLRPVEGYGQFLYIDRGYAFFAPDPGPSHLVQAAITDRGGEQVEKMFPDRQQHWPRLLYHRHFMLTEFLDEIYQPPGPPPELVELDRTEAQLWLQARARYEHIRQSYVEHLKYEHPGRDVAIRRIEHRIPGLIEFQTEPVALTDPDLYGVILDLPITLGGDGDLAAPAGPPETIPPPDGATIESEDEANSSAETVVNEEESTDDAEETDDAVEAAR